MAPIHQQVHPMAKLQTPLLPIQIFSWVEYEKIINKKNKNAQNQNKFHLFVLQRSWLTKVSHETTE